MMSEHVYYCWYCDAHRVAQGGKTTSLTCGCCGRELPAEARLARETKSEPKPAPRDFRPRPLRMAAAACFSLPG